MKYQRFGGFLMKKDEIAYLKDINILDYCRMNNIPLSIQKGRYVKHLDHNSLVFDSYKNTFFWNSRQAHGDIITFIQEYYSVNFKTAIEILTGIAPSMPHLDQIKDSPFPTEFCIDSVKESTNNKNIFAYLIKTRGLSFETVQYFHKRRYIRQDVKNNIIFYVYDADKNVIGAYLKGTNTYKDFKFEYPGTPNTGIPVPFCENPKVIYFFESFIDLMSFYELYPKLASEALFLSFNGLKDNCLCEVLKRHPNAAYRLAIDNDAGANTFFERISNNESLKGHKFERLLPRNKDWNDDLKEIKNLQSNQKEHYFQGLSPG